MVPRQKTLVVNTPSLCDRRRVLQAIQSSGPGAGLAGAYRFCGSADTLAPTWRPVAALRGESSVGFRNVRAGSVGRLGLVLHSLHTTVTEQQALLELNILQGEAGIIGLDTRSSRYEAMTPLDIALPCGKFRPHGRGKSSRGPVRR